MRSLALSICLIVIGCHHGPSSTNLPPQQPRQWPPARPAAYANPIPAENALPGDSSWKTFRESYNHQVEAYADRVSAKAGDSVSVMASADSSIGATWTLYRLGWYQGAGARKVLEGSAFQLATQPACANDSSTGLIKCAWTPSFQIALPASSVSGLYLVRITRSDNFASLVPLVVKDDRASDLFLQASTNTYQAYNSWGGESLYSDDDGLAGHKGLKVSYDRPYASDHGSGQVLRYEALMARFLERSGYDVSYTTDLDVAREGSAALLKRGAFLSVGHDEYWSGEERDAAEGARDAGVPELFLGANVGYWKVRLDDPGADGNARTITCYKQYPAKDPLAGTPSATGLFRDPIIARDEEELVGTMYESWLLFGHPWVVSDAASFLYQGTGLSNGDSIPLLVGYEYDRTFNRDTPGKLDVVAHSPVVDAEGKPGFADAVTYQAPSGAWVFGAGSIYWARGVDGAQRDARVERMTANLLEKALSLPIPAALQIITPPAGQTPAGAWAQSVATLSQGSMLQAPTSVAQLPDGSLVVADPRAHQIFQVGAGGQVSVYAGDGHGTGQPGYDNVPGLKARFYQPTSVLADALGVVYVADTHNHAIRRIGNDADHTVTTIAGVLGVADFADGVGAAARFSDPMGLSFLDPGHLLVADAANNRIRILELATGTVTTLAGSGGGQDLDGPGASAQFDYPTAVVAGAGGAVYFVDSAYGKIKRIAADPGHTVSAITLGGLGFGDGSGTTAAFTAQGGLAWDGQALLVSDPGNQRLRRVVPGTDASTTQVTTLAGSGKVGAADASGSAASFGLPLGLLRAPDGTLYLADAANASIRVVHP